MNRLKKVSQWLGMFILAVLVLLAAFMMIGPRFGWETHPVLSGSMEPSLNVGGLIVTRQVKLEEVKVGDIIAFQSGENSVTHRVVGISDEGGKLWFETKGDANENPDPKLISSKKDEIDRVVFHLPYMGFMASFMKTRLAFMLMIGIPGLLLIWMLGKETWEGILQEREKRRLRRGGGGQGVEAISPPQFDQ